MTRSPHRTAEPLILSGGKLGELAFEWIEDRYRHHWRLGDVELLSSTEGHSGCAWPESPPLQQIHLQSFGDGREVVFGVGMSGRGHWSASFTLVPDLKCWIVELACRSSTKPESLASSYRLGNGWTSASGGSWELPVGEVVARMEPIPPTTIATRAGDVLSMQPALIVDMTPSTTQWAFRLRISQQ